ncbi:MAG: 30S ribosomal protein S3 [Coriobacteriales bacterium]|nr:30S ribosomal protein S3 [Coriobacteriales bacterium]
MGQKVIPTGFRLGITEEWKSRWYALDNYSQALDEDLKLRKYIEKKLYEAAISKVEIERVGTGEGNSIKAILYTARPGIVIGKKGQEVEYLKKDLEKMAGCKVDIEVKEIKSPELDARLVAQSVAAQLEGRVAFRRAMRKSVLSAMKTGAKGIKIQCSGRLGGAEMSRTEWYREGRVPLHTMRAMIDYGTCVAHTTYGAIGIKVWIYYGEKLPGKPCVNPALEGSASQRRGPRSRTDGRK